MVADNVLATFPYTRISGLDDVPDHDFSLIYRLAPPQWLSDSTIRIVCNCLCNDFATARFGGIQSAAPKPRTRSKSTQNMDQNIITAVKEAVNTVGVES